MTICEECGEVLCPECGGRGQQDRTGFDFRQRADGRIEVITGHIGKAAFSGDALLANVCGLCAGQGHIYDSPGPSPRLLAE